MQGQSSVHLCLAVFESYHTGWKVFEKGHRHLSLSFAKQCSVVGKHEHLGILAWIDQKSHLSGLQMKISSSMKPCLFTKLQHGFYFHSSRLWKFGLHQERMQFPAADPEMSYHQHCTHLVQAFYSTLVRRKIIWRSYRHTIYEHQYKITDTALSFIIAYLQVPLHLLGEVKQWRATKAYKIAFKKKKITNKPILWRGGKITLQNVHFQLPCATPHNDSTGDCRKA